jgi:hypothetical protein
MNPQNLLAELQAEINACTLDDGEERDSLIELLNYYAGRLAKLEFPPIPPTPAWLITQKRAEYQAIREQLAVA